MGEGAVVGELVSRTNAGVGLIGAKNCTLLLPPLLKIRRGVG